MSKYKFGDFAINCTEKKMPEPEDYANYIGLEHMDSKCLKITRWGSDVPIIGEKLVMHKGDILLGKRNAYLRRAAIAPFDGIFSAHGMILRPKEDIVDYDFFALFIASDYFFDEAIRISVGSLSPTINWKDLKELEFNIPDIATQKEIAKVLWSITDTIDSYKELIKQSDELVKSRFIEMFGDLNSSPIYPGIKLKEICKTLSGGTPTTKHPEYYEGNIPWITTVQLGPNYIDGSNPKAFITQDAIDNSATHLIPANNILFGTRVGVGKCSINTEAICTNQDINAIIDIDTHKWNLLFIKQVLDNYLPYFDSIKKGATILGITTDDLKGVEIPNVEKSIQDEFASFVEQIDKSKFELQNCVDKANAMYKKIMKENLGKEEE